MGRSIVYSSEGYTLSIANRLRKAGVACTEVQTENDFVNILNDQGFDLVVLDSTTEKMIEGMARLVRTSKLNAVAGILYVIPGKITHDLDSALLSKAPLAGLSKPFTAAELEGLSRSLMDRKEQHSQLEAAFEELEQFAVMASHDLKTPVKNIYSYADLFLEELQDEDVQLNDELVEYIRVIRNESERMINFVNDMFEFSRAGKVALSPETISFKPFIESIFKASLAATSHPNAKLRLVNTPETLFTDKSKLYHIFQNLLENALKYGLKHDGLVIEVGTVNTRTGPAIFVKDNGSGIREEDIDTIFEPFKRGKSDVKGTGIGLAIVKKLAKALGGEIYVESEFGKGANFLLTYDANIWEVNHDEAA